jgi:protein O-mannosyl-transferase
MSRKRKKPPPDDLSRPSKAARSAGGSRLPGKDRTVPPGMEIISASSRSRRAAIIVCALLLLAVAIVFGQTVRHGFIELDDSEYVVHNQAVADGFTVDGIVWAFTHFHSANWHPLTWLSHALDCQIYGLDHPGGHHLTNLLLHAASSVLLFLVLRQMTGDLWPSAAVAALFAIHPLHVESVAWVAERKDVLSGLLFMLVLAAYVSYVRRPFSLLRYLLVTALFALGLMAKPMLVTLPFVLLLLDYWPLGRIGAPAASLSPADPTPQNARSWRRVLLEKLPWLCFSAISCVLTYGAQGEAVQTSAALPFSQRLANALVSYAGYLGQFFYPAKLAIYYPHPQDELPWATILGAALLVAAISLVALAGRRKYPYLAVGWLWYLGMLVPVIGLVQVGSQAMADRYAYLTQIGLYIALAWGLERLSRQWSARSWMLGAASAAVLIVLARCAWLQTAYWQDEVTLWRHTLDCTSDNCFAHYHYASALVDRPGPEDVKRDDLEKAVGHYREALRIKPDYEEAYLKLGNILTQQGKTDEALAHYRTILQFKPDYAGAYNNIGALLAGQGRLDEAVAHYENALKYNPDFADAHLNLGNVLTGRGRQEEAVAQYEAALRLEPRSAKAHNNLGVALARLGRNNEAVAHLQQALKIDPHYAEAARNLRTVQERMKKP